MKPDKDPIEVRTCRFNLKGLLDKTSATSALSDFKTAPKFKGSGGLSALFPSSRRLLALLDGHRLVMS